MVAAIGCDLDLLRRGGYLAVAVGFDALRLDTRLNYKLGDRVVHGPADVLCNAGAVPGRSTVAELLDGISAGVIDHVCVCFSLHVDDPASPLSLIEWAWDLTTGPLMPPSKDTPSADRVHALRYLAGLGVLPEDRHAAVTAAALRIGAEQEATLVASPGYRAEVVAKARKEAPQHVTFAGAPDWLPGPGDLVAPQPGQSDEDAYTDLVNGPHLWHRVDADTYARVGYRWATSYDTTHQIARTPLVFWPLIFLTIGERFLCVDDDYTAADVAWAASQRDTDLSEVADLVAALAASRT